VAEEDDRYDDDGNEPETLESQLALARRKVAAPAILLIILGFIGIVLHIVGFVMTATNPTVFLDWYEVNVIGAFPAAMKEDLQDQFESTRDTMRLDSPLNLGYSIFGFACCLCMLLGGTSMKSLSNYKLAMFGSLCALVPMTICCFVSPLLGLWTTIILCQDPVLRGFRITRLSNPAGGGS